jgi:cobalamin biosynthesis protein CobD/CbiB
MVLTPSNSGNLVAGAGLGVFAWSAFLKADKIPWLKNLLTTRRKEMTLDWIDKNKGISLLGLETINLGIHGILSANAVIFALGNTLLNIFMLWAYLPFRQMKAKQQHVHEVLKKAA